MDNKQNNEIINVKDLMIVCLTAENDDLKKALRRVKNKNTFVALLAIAGFTTTFMVMKRNEELETKISKIENKVDIE